MPQGVGDREALGESEEVLDPEMEVLGERVPVGEMVELGVLPPPAPLPPTPGGEREEVKEGVEEVVEDLEAPPLPLTRDVEVGARGVCDTLPVGEMEEVEVGR